MDRLIPPALFDQGFDGSWIVTDDGRTICNAAYWLARNPAAVLSAPDAAFADPTLLHSTTPSGEETHDHGASTRDHP